MVVTVAGPVAVWTTFTGTPRPSVFASAKSWKATSRTPSCAPSSDRVGSIASPSRPSFICRFHSPFLVCQRKPIEPSGMRGAPLRPSHTRYLNAAFSTPAVRSSSDPLRSRPGTRAPSRSSSRTRNGASL